jgi:hypothetical protein
MRYYEVTENDHLSLSLGNWAVETEYGVYRFRTEQAAKDKLGFLRELRSLANGAEYRV